LINNLNGSIRTESFASLGNTDTYKFSVLSLTNNGVINVDTNICLDISSTRINASPIDSISGINIHGGELKTSPDFSFTNYMIRVTAENSFFSPSGSLAVGNRASFVIDKKTLYDQ
ncbi:MAG: hypothetical protein GX811_13190, partial [Lentisphaerae bacterium]|nr:hypothetical protein [Lentisphaerota bacterium]